MTDEWAGLLHKDEIILWQGAPQIRLRIDWDSPAEMLGSLFFMGFAVFWMMKASESPGPAWMVGLIFFGMGFYNLVLSHFWKAYKRRHTHYTLTDKRAFVATFDWIKGKRLESYPISSSTVLSLHEGKLTTIDFASKTVGSGDSTRETSVGFEDLIDGRDVYALMRNLQEGTE